VVAVVEGYTDVMMAHQFGASNVVSVLGTAMTEQHVGVLRRFADRIVLLFDADSAGDAAVDRVVQLFLTQPVEIGVATMPAGLDPDEFLLKEGAKGFEQLIGGAADALEYAWKQLVRRFVSEAGDLTGQQKAAQQYLDLLANARKGGPVDTLRWGSALARVSRLTEIPVEVLHRKFGKTGQKEANRPISGQNIEASPSARPTGGRYLAESQVLGVLLLTPGIWGKVQTVLSVQDFGDPTLKALAEVYWNHQREEGEPVFNEFIDSLKEAELKSLAIELADAVEELDLEVTLSGALQYLAESRHRSAEQKMVATRRTGEEQELSEEEQIQLLTKLQERPPPGFAASWAKRYCSVVKVRARDSDQKSHRASARMMTKAVTGIGNVSEFLGLPRFVLLARRIEIRGRCWDCVKHVYIYRISVDWLGLAGRSRFTRRGVDRSWEVSGVFNLR
jgi:DNA primase